MVWNCSGGDDRGSNYVGCKVFMKFYRADLEIWGSGVGRLRCRAVVAGAAEVGVGGEKLKKFEKNQKFRKVIRRSEMDGNVF